MSPKAWIALALALLCAWAHAQTGPPAGAGPQGVVVVLAGGGAKGFAHLAVLRQLETDRVPIARIVGTSMGAVIGSLYASGMDTDEIERVIGGLDPAKVALDQVDRLELPPSVRAYQQQYPIDFEFGLSQGGLSFARGFSDGQRLTALLQKLFAHLPAELDFNRLRIPLRVVATRYRDGEARVFDRGALHLAVRASMAAPGAFAPVEIDGEVYVDGGLVANLPVEVALSEGAQRIVASFLGQTQDKVSAANALVVANHMITLLLQQNERRNLALLRPQDVLVQAELGDVGFADFNRAKDIIARGEQALQAVAPAWQQMVAQQGRAERAPQPRLAMHERDIRITEVRVQGQTHVSPGFVQSQLADLKDKAFDAAAVAAQIDRLYTSGHFEQVTYALEQLRNDQYALVVKVVEKSYGPNFFRTTLGFSSELHGVTQFSFGLGYRRPWLTPEGLELQVGARLGTLNELNAGLVQPMAPGWTLEAGLGLRNNLVPYYDSDSDIDIDTSSRVPAGQRKRQGFVRDARKEIFVGLSHEFRRASVMKLGLVRASQRYSTDTLERIYAVSEALAEPMLLEEKRSDARLYFTAARWQWDIDQLDSLSFPTQGYALGLRLEHGLGSGRYRRSRAQIQWAQSWGPHVLNLGGHWAQDQQLRNCDSCSAPTQLFMGGFQFMGAYRMGQLYGDQLAHAHSTYMYRLSDGGLLRQKSFLGLVAEVGDAWDSNTRFHARTSLSLFLAVDSRIGDIYLGAARGSGTQNLFLQLGRRFQF